MSDENETRDRQPEGRRPAWRSGAPSGQERVVSYESDERYWTDYLRVALPVVGLLLMLGLLVWWANSIIGDEQGAQPTSTVASSTQIVTSTPNTPTNTPESNLTATEVPVGTTPGASGGNGDDPTETPAEGGDTAVPDNCDGDFARGDSVVVTDDDVNLRESADVTSDALDQLAADTVLTIVSDCYTEGPDGTLFWRVSVDDADPSLRGYVSNEFLDPA